MKERKRKIKIGGEHITAGSYYNPAVILHHRRAERERERKEDGARILPHGTGPTRRAPRTLDPLNRGVGEAEEPVRNQVFLLDANTQK